MVPGNSRYWSRAVAFVEAASRGVNRVPFFGVMGKLELALALLIPALVIYWTAFQPRGIDGNYVFHTTNLEGSPKGSFLYEEEVYISMQWEKFHDRCIAKEFKQYLSLNGWTVSLPDMTPRQSPPGVSYVSFPLNPPVPLIPGDWIYKIYGFYWCNPLVPNKLREYPEIRFSIVK